MKKRNKAILYILIPALASLTILLSACSSTTSQNIGSSVSEGNAPLNNTADTDAAAGDTGAEGVGVEDTGAKDASADAAPGSGGNKQSPAAKPEGRPSQEDAADNGELKVTANPEAVTVLVNKQNRLPEKYEPADLVYPDVPFIFTEKIEKRMLRKPAADALKQLFDGASKDGIHLAGVSGYRSESRQKVLFDQYVAKDGLEKAKTYSAVPGTSEHQTGLAIDLSGSDGKCAAEDCFGSTPEARWLADHAAEYGFIIRYPEGKQAITGYKYEPWHIRYVGVDMAKDITAQGVTLEEYFGESIPVISENP